MLDNCPANGCANFSRRVLLAPFAVEYQFFIRAEEKVHADLPFTAPLYVEVLRQVIGRIEPQLKPFNFDRLYPSHVCPCLIEPPELSIRLDRTSRQSTAIHECPIVVNLRFRDDAGIHPSGMATLQ